MIVASFAAGPAFRTNCYVVAPGPRSEAIVIDPGQDALPGIRDLCDRHHLRPVAAVATHGHLDHVWTIAPLADGYGIPAWIHPADRPMLTDRFGGLGPQLGRLFPGLNLTEPEDVRELEDRTEVELAGVRLLVDHTPGHTPGHVTLHMDDRLFSGDLVFAGSVGRTDLPGGDAAQLRSSIGERFLTLPDETVVLPGHGPRTTVGAERVGNPFLHDWGLTAS